MIDCHLIIFLDNENLGVGLKISFLNRLVPTQLQLDI